MRKIFSYILIFILGFSLFIDTPLAYTFEVSATSYSVTVGNTVTLNIKVKDAAGKFSISSSDASVVSVSTSSAWIDNGTQSVTLKANKAGTATIYVNAADVTTYDGGNVSITKQVKITVNPKPTQNTTTNNNSGTSNTITRAKSTNNFLTSLTVDGLEISPKFDKEKLEYEVTVPAETEKIKINAQLADSSAKVNGVGEVKVSTGVNNFEIIVTAENGSKRTYKLKATVLELEPLNVKVGNDTYSIVRKRKDLPEISEYNVIKDITIDNNIIEGYFNEKLNYDLVGLKDSAGLVKYYIYKNNTYTPYNEYTFNGTTLQILDKEIDGLKKVDFVYDNDKITSYQEIKLDLIKNTYALDNNDITGNQFYLFYAKNVETGREYLYQYDALEKTVQRYNTNVLDMYKENSDTYYKYLIISLGVVGVLIVTLGVSLTSKRNKKKNIKTRKKVDED